MTRHSEFLGPHLQAFCTEYVGHGKRASSVGKTEELHQVEN